MWNSDSKRKFNFLGIKSKKISNEKKDENNVQIYHIFWR